MPTADELLASSASTDSSDIANRFIVSEDLRTITIPTGQSVLGVVNDSDVRKVWFTMPRVCDGTDLSDFTVFVNYVNAQNVSNRYQVPDSTIGQDSITFAWLVGRSAFTAAGTVTFNVDLKLYDTDGVTVLKEFNTTTAAMQVLSGLSVTSVTPAQTYVDEIQAALLEMVQDQVNAQRIVTVAGTVQSYQYLPSNAQVGAMYNVLDTGRNYVWNGTSWDDLGGVDTLTVTETSDADIDAMFE